MQSTIKFELVFLPLWHCFQSCSKPPLYHFCQIACFAKEQEFRFRKVNFPFRPRTMPGRKFLLAITEKSKRRTCDLLPRSAFKLRKRVVQSTYRFAPEEPKPMSKISGAVNACVLGLCILAVGPLPGSILAARNCRPALPEVDKKG